MTKNMRSAFAARPLRLALAAMLLTTALSAQKYDTLHLYYSNIAVTPHDTTQAKMDKWIKSLNGKHQDIRIVAYYHKFEFKKYAQERLDEMFLIINRKARSLFTITEQVAQKGKDYQRTTVDIIYTPSAGSQAATSKETVKPATGGSGTEKGKDNDVKTKKEPESKAAKKEPKEKEQGEKEKNSGNGAVAVNDDKKEKKGGKENKEEKERKGEKKDKNDGNQKLTAEEKKAQKAELEAAEKARKAEEEKYGSPRIKQAGDGQWIKSGDLEAIKGAKVIVGETGDKAADKRLLEAVKNFWTFNSEISSMPYNEARELAKKDEKVVVMSVASMQAKSITRRSTTTENKGDLVQITTSAITYISDGTGLIIENGKGKTLASQYIPAFGEDEVVTSEALAFGVSALNYMLTTMVEKNLSSNLKFKDAYKEHSEKLKTKKLLIPEPWIKDLGAKTVKETYKADAEIVGYEEWRDAILGKKDVAYVIITPVPIGGEFTYVHYLMDAQSGRVYAMTYPKVGVSVMKKNVLKSNTGKINEKNIEKYNDAIKGDW
jgi:hypothetical protein